MESSPTHFAFGGKAFAMTCSDHTCLTERRSNPFDRLLRVLRGRLRTSRAIDANHAVLAHAVIVQNTCDAAGFADGVDELGSLLD